MSRFTHIEYSLEHAGVVRAERAIDNVKRLTEGQLGAGILYLAAVVSAVLAFASQMAGDWSDAVLTVSLMAVWALAFVAMIVKAGAVGSAVRSLKTTTAKYSEARRARADDEAMARLMLTDARLMADVSRAMTRDAAREVRGYY